MRYGPHLDGRSLLALPDADRLERLGLVAAVVRLEGLLPAPPRTRQQVGRLGGVIGTLRSWAHCTRSNSPMWKVSTTSRLLKSAWS